MKIGKYTVELSNQDKVLFPKSGITKGDLVDYYKNIADIILPHLKDRPVTMQRYPNGIDSKGFFQKDRSDYFPDWIESVKVSKQGGSVDMVIANNQATLVYLANQAVIIPHIWLSRKDKLDYPDKMIFDLDPPGRNFDLVVKGAYAIKDVLEELGLNSYVMTTGSEGIHVTVPLARQQDFDEVRDFAGKISQYLAEKNPEDFTVEVRKDKRKGRLFLDYLRNAYAQTGVTPYGVRAKENAPVATPLEWNELGHKNIDAQAFNIKNIFKRLDKKDDPWRDFKKHGKSIKEPSRKLEKKLEKETEKQK